MRGRTWAWVGLAAVLVFGVWWRAHAVGPILRDRLGVDLYPVTGGAAEPLDCDEAIYTYIGKRLAGGAVMYRDLTENKPPLGYWLFALAVSAGGANELTVRLMPIPLVLGTTTIVWWLALRLRGPGAAVLAALTCVLLSSDPFLYGDGNQMEHMINLPATASLALLVAAWDRPGRARLVAAGASLGAAALIRQVAVVNWAVFVLALLLRRTIRSDVGEQPRSRGDRLKDVAALTVGVATACGFAALILVAQGAGWDAWNDIIGYGAALVKDTPPDPNAPPFLIRWFTGNADGSGLLPWPFGPTERIKWWGTGIWPVWLAGVPGLVWMVAGPIADPRRRLVAAWTLSAWVQVAMPRLFWHHYYLLPVPGLAVVVSVFLADLIALAWSRRVVPALSAVLVTFSLVWTARLQAVDYLWLAPEQVTVVKKNGIQWMNYRAMGRELSRRTVDWRRPTLYVWGWQSPLFVYTRFESVTRQVFTDPFLMSHAADQHSQARPRLDRTMRDLRADPPTFIYCGYAPFPELRSFLEERYYLSHGFTFSLDGRGLWVEKSKYGEFETSYPPFYSDPAAAGSAAPMTR